jgi:hypothetical protein
MLTCAAPPPPQIAVPEGTERCTEAQLCEWCLEPLEAGTGDEFREWSHGCCRFCLEIE